MSQHHAENKEPLVHLSKRPAVHPVKGALIRLIAILLGLVVCGLVAFLLIEKVLEKPEKIWDFYNAFIKGSFSTPRKFWKFLRSTAVLPSAPMPMSASVCTNQYMSDFLLVFISS